MFADESVAADTDSAADSSFDDTADDAAEEDLPDDAVQLAPGTEIELVELDSLAALDDFGRLVVPIVPNAPPVPADIDFEAPFDTCEDRFDVEELVGPARYLGDDVIVGVDLDAATVFAYTAECELVAQTPLPDTPRGDADDG